MTDSTPIQDAITRIRLAIPRKEDREYLRHVNRRQSGVQPCPRCGGRGRTWNPDAKHSSYQPQTMACYRCAMTGTVTNPDIRLSPDWDPRYAADGPELELLPVPVMTVMENVPDGRGGLHSPDVVASRFLSYEEAKTWADEQTAGCSYDYYWVPDEYAPEQEDATEPNPSTEREVSNELPF